MKSLNITFFVVLIAIAFLSFNVHAAGTSVHIDANDAFGFLDRNGNGFIEVNELLAVERSLGNNPTEQDVIDKIALYDLDYNDMLSEAEYLAMTSA